MLTAKSELEDKLLGFNEGANDYIPKPFHIDELVARVNAQLRIELVKDNNLEFGDLILNIKTSDTQITPNRAKEIALAHAGVAEAAANFKKIKLDNKNGKSVYEIEFIANNSRYELSIDAGNGSVIKFEKR